MLDLILFTSNVRRVKFLKLSCVKNFFLNVSNEVFSRTSLLGKKYLSLTIQPKYHTIDNIWY